MPLPLSPLYVIINLLRHVFAINKECNALCCQSLCEVVVRSCRREVQSKLSVLWSVWNLLLPLLHSVCYIIIAVSERYY